LIVHGALRRFLDKTKQQQKNETGTAAVVDGYAGELRSPMPVPHARRRRTQCKTEQDEGGGGVKVKSSKGTLCRYCREEEGGQIA